MILYIENSEESIKIVLGLINEFSKVAEYKINILKSVVCLYTCNEYSEKDFLNSIYNSMKERKYLEINLT